MSTPKLIDCITHSGFSILSVAIVRGEIEMVRLLIKGGVDLNKISGRSYLQTPLSRAMMHGWGTPREIVKLLKDAGAKA